MRSVFLVLLFLGMSKSFLLQVPVKNTGHMQTRAIQNCAMFSKVDCIQQRRHEQQSITVRSSAGSDTPVDGGDDENEEDDDEVEPGKMRVSEIKAELDMRGVSYADCFDKESLQQRLVDARLSGKANPELIDKFNKQRVRV